MAGIYGSLAQGIESGFGMAQRAAEFEEQKRHRKVLEDNQAAADMRAAETHTLTTRRLGQQLDEHDENRNFGVIQGRLTEVERQARAAQAAGSPIPPALAEEHGRLTGIMADRAKRAAARLSPTAQTGNAPPTAEAEAAGVSGGSGAASVVQQAKDFWSRAATGQINPLDAPGPELRMHLSAATGVKVDELPTVVDGVRDVQTGLQTGNNGLIVSGMNKAMTGRLRIGVGGPSPYGGTITRKEIIGLDPAIDANGQQHPNRFIPRLRVYVGGVSPAGDELYYDAPMTRKGSTDKDDPVVAIDINKGLDWAGNVTMLGTLLQHPQFAAKVAGASGDDADKFVDSMRNLQNLTMPKVRVEKLQSGALVRVHEDGSVEPLVDAAPKPMTPLQEAQARAANARAGVNEKRADGTLPAPARAGKGGGLRSPALGDAPAPTKSDEAVEFWARAVIAGDKDWQVGLSRGKEGAKLIADVKRRVPSLAKELGLEPQDIGTTRAQSAALAATMKDLTKRSEAIDLFSSKVERDMQTYDQILTKAGSNSPILINKPINFLRRQFSDPELAQLDLAARQVGMEYERLLTGGTLSIAQLHIGAQEDAKKLINGDMPPKQARAVMETMRQEMVNARTAAHESTARISAQMRNLGRGTGPAAGPAPVPAPASAPAAAATPQPAAGMPQRPAGVPPTAKYSPSRNEWWDGGQKVWPR